MLRDRPGRQPDVVSIDNMPPGYREVYEDSSSGLVDPVMQYCKRHSTPLMWDQGTYTRAGKGGKWEVQARHGLHTGIALALHLPKGFHFFIGVDRDKVLPVDLTEVTRMAADLHLFATYAQEAALRLLLPALPHGNVPALTPRELETLRWTMEGKTAWELGRILGISEQTAVRHVNNAMHKLNCVNKHHAVVTALRLGLIH